MPSTLKEEIKTITGNRRKFLLMRIVDMDVNTALTLCGVKRGTYNTWCQNPAFVSLYRRRNEFAGEHKQEAIQLLRRDNQLAAVLLESKILNTMKEEIESGNLSLVKTNLAREVYSRLMGDLDVKPEIKSLTWDQRVINLTGGNPAPQLSKGETIDGEITKISVEYPSPEGQEQSEGDSLREDLS